MRVLTVYAHPDDESFGPASVLARWAREGAEIHGVWFTRGEHGASIEHPPPDTAELARIRERNVREAAALIGYRSVSILDYEDGSLDGVRNLHLLVLGYIREHEPEVVMTFGPAGITRHRDHLAVHRATFSKFVRAQASGIPVRELYYGAVTNEHAHKLASPTSRTATRTPGSTSRAPSRSRSRRCASTLDTSPTRASAWSGWSVSLCPSKPSSAPIRPPRERVL